MALGEHPKRLKADPQLALELEVCHHYRIPHSTFLSWSADDRDKATWQLVRDRQTCPSCGTRPEEWDPERGGDRAAYRAVIDVCRGCQERESRIDTMTDIQRGRGVFVRLQPQGGADGQSP